MSKFKKYNIFNNSYEPFMGAIAVMVLFGLIYIFVG